MACVLIAAEEAGVKVDAVMLKTSPFESLQRQPVAASGVEWLNDEARRVLRGGVVFSFIGGGRHQSSVLRRHPQPFDLVLPEAPDLPIDPEAEIVPFGAMRAMLEMSLTRDLSRLEDVVEIATGQVYHFETPPPMEDEWVKDQRPTKWASHWKLSSTKYLMYKLWRLNSQIIRAHAERLGVVFVERPQGAVNEEGLLRAEFVENLTHGNAKYGALVLEQMEALS
jgi:hypothetical protein